MKRRSDEEISAPLYEYDAAVRSQYGCFAGVDEAGRGPLCGPVCVAACILDPENPVFGINDSKKLTEKKPSTASSRSTAAASSKSRATGRRTESEPRRDRAQGRSCCGPLVSEAGLQAAGTQLPHPDG